MLESRTEQSVVDGEQGAARMPLNRIGRGLEVSHGERRVRRRLDQNQPEVFVRLDRGGNPSRVARPDPVRGETQWLQHVMDQVLRAAIQRLRIKQRAPTFEEPQHHSEDRRHAGIKNRRGRSLALQWNELIFEDLGVRMIESRVN